MNRLAVAARFGALVGVAGSAACRTAAAPPQSLAHPGAPQREAAPLAGGVPPAASGERVIVKRTFDNGLVVVVEERPSSPVVALQLWVRAGSADERAEESGLAHVHEHMLFKGTTRRGVGGIAGEIEAAGGDINAWTSLDQTVFHVVISSRFWERGLDVLADAVRDPAFDAGELDKERRVILEELRSAKDLPSREVNRALFQTAYPDHPYGRPVLGVEATLSAFQRDDVLAFYRKHYRPDRVVLAVAGGVSAAEVVAAAHERLADWRVEGSAPAHPGPPADATAGPAAAVARDGITEAHLALGWRIAEAAHADVPALDVLAILLGQGESCRLNQEVRRKRRLVNDVQAFSFTPRLPGVMLLGATTGADRAVDAVHGLLDEVLRLRHERVSADELRKARTMVEADTVFQRETVEGAARRLGYWESVAGDPAAEDRYLDAVRGVSADDLLIVARKYLVPSRLTISALLPRDAPGPDGAALVRAVADSERRVGDRYAAAAPSAAPGEVLDVRLENGMRVLVLEDRSVPLVALRALFPGGLRFETPRTAGIHNFLSELVTLGAANRSAEEIAKAVDALAGRLTGFSGRNSFGLSGEFLARDFREGLELFAECMLRPSFPSDEVEKTRSLLLEDVRAQEDNPSGIAFRTFGRALFGDHPYSLDVLGTAESLAALDAEALRAHYEAHFPPGAATLAVVGAVSPAEVLREVRRHFESDRREAAPPPPIAPWERPVGPRTLLRTKDRAQAHVVVGWPGTTIDAPDRFAVEALSTLLGGQSGRLFIELRERRGLAYSVTSLNLEGVEPGYFAVYAATAPEKVEETLAAIDETLAAVIAEPPRDEDLERARRYLVGAHDIGLQRIGAVASTLGFDAAFGLGPLAHRRHAERMLAVTAAEVQAAAARYLRPELRTVVIVGPEGTKAPGDPEVVEP